MPATVEKPKGIVAGLDDKPVEIARPTEADVTDFKPPAVKQGDYVRVWRKRDSKWLLGIVTEVYERTISCSVIHRGSSMLDATRTCLRHRNDPANTPGNTDEFGVWDVSEWEMDYQKLKQRVASLEETIATLVGAG